MYNFKSDVNYGLYVIRMHLHWFNDSDKHAVLVKIVIKGVGNI